MRWCSLVRTGERADVGSIRRRTSMLIESGLSVLRLQRWMGHHSPAFTLETYGRPLDGDLGPALDPGNELRPARR
jgi:hypothetical protein